MKQQFKAAFAVLAILALTIWQADDIYHSVDGEASVLQPQQLESPVNASNGKQGLMSEKKKRVKGQLNFDAPDKFAEYHRAIRTRDGADGPAYQANYRIHELLKARQFTSTVSLGKQSAQHQLDWQERGPAM